MIIVTGTSRGIGRDIALNLSDQGLEVIGLSRSLVPSTFPQFAIDVANYDSIKEFVGNLKSEHKEISALINCAGIASMNLAVLTPSHVTRKIIETNLLGTIFCCQLFSPLLIRNGFGSIINFSTIAVSLNLEGESVYVASKAGVEAFTRVIAKELAGHNIRANCIAPGPIQTSLLSGVSEEQIDKIVQSQIIKKRFSKKDICDIVNLLLSENAKSLTGQVFNVGGI